MEEGSRLTPISNNTSDERYPRVEGNEEDNRFPGSSNSRSAVRWPTEDGTEWESEL